MLKGLLKIAILNLLIEKKLTDRKLKKVNRFFTIERTTVECKSY